MADSGGKRGNGVADRVSTFADPEVIRLARRFFVPVAGDDWYQRRRRDAEGEFFRHVADQGPRKGRGGSTRQGIYVLTAGGRLLAYRNNRDPDVMRNMLTQALRDWQGLPASERRPGAVRVPGPGRADPRYSPTLPAGALVLDVWTRILDRTRSVGLVRGSCRFRGGDRAAHDHLWLTQAEGKSLLPADARPGASIPVPRRLLLRLVRFHLVDNTRGEPPHWSLRQVRRAEAKLTVEDAGPAGVRLRLDGSALLATDADPKRAERGFDVRLLGYVHFDADRKAIDQFEVVAVGDHWGEGRFTPGARPGRTPLGVALSLARGAAPADRVPPQRMREVRGYWEAEHE
jgi:hypothetical protein